MSYLHYHHTRSRDPSPFSLTEDPYYTRPLVRRNSKRQRVEVYDEEPDDYPGYTYSTRTVKPASRALTVKGPSQLEKYNVWSYTPSSPSHDQHHHHHYSDSDDHHGHRSSSKYKYTLRRTSSKGHRRRETEFSEPEVEVKFKSSAHRRPSVSSKDAMHWPGDLFKRREKWDGVEWESRERERGERWWDDEEPAVREKAVRYRRIKRTRTDEWKPLSGFKHW